MVNWSNWANRSLLLHFFYNEKLAKKESKIGREREKEREREREREKDRERETERERPSFARFAQFARFAKFAQFARFAESLIIFLRRRGGVTFVYKDEVDFFCMKRRE